MSYSGYHRTVNAHPADPDQLFAGSITASPDVLMQELPGNEAIFLDLRTESYFGLDAIGTKMYGALTEAPTVRDAYERLIREFEVEPERLRRDLIRFVERLVSKGLIVFHGAG